MKCFWLALSISLLLSAGCGLFKHKPNADEQAKIEQSKIQAQTQANIETQKAQGEAKTAPAILGEKLIWIIAGCIVGTIASVLLIFRGYLQWGIGLAAGCAVGLVLAVSVWQQFAWIARYGLVVIAVAVAGTVIFVLWRAIPQLVKTTEKAKESMDVSALGELFGGNDDHGQAGQIQSKATETLVAQIRKKLTEDKAKETKKNG